MKAMAVFVRMVFLGVEELYVFAQRFLSHCETLQASYSDTTLIAPLFLNTSFDVFLKFVDNYANALGMIKRAEESHPAFKQFNEQCKWMAQTHKQSIQDFLILPIQRVTRYPLFLKDTLKHTPQDHPDFLGVVQACQQMKAMATQVNLVKQKEEEMNGMFIMFKRVQECPATVIKYGRRVVFEVEVTLLQPSQLLLRLFLLNDLLLLSKRRRKKKKPGVVLTPHVWTSSPSFSSSSSSTSLSFMSSSSYPFYSSSFNASSSTPTTTTTTPTTTATSATSTTTTAASSSSSSMSTAMTTPSSLALLSSSSTFSSSNQQQTPVDLKFLRLLDLVDVDILDAPPFQPESHLPLSGGGAPSSSSSSKPSTSITLSIHPNTLSSYSATLNAKHVQDTVVEPLSYTFHFESTKLRDDFMGVLITKIKLAKEAKEKESTNTTASSSASNTNANVNANATLYPTMNKELNSTSNPTSTTATSSSSSSSSSNRSSIEAHPGSSGTTTSSGKTTLNRSFHMDDTHVSKPSIVSMVTLPTGSRGSGTDHLNSNLINQPSSSGNGHLDGGGGGNPTWNDLNWCTSP
ncbi:hypothetical protein HMI55_003912 [Coelomomyces lativittatus]|nr:hypothetical protein HMI55_003912 [Coelomomyces lativittatus]